MFCTYFADARSGIHIPSVTDVSSSSHWMDTNIFGHNRVVFDTSPGPENARLKIFNVSESDDGIYRCRVDFKASQTRTSRLNLTVVGKWIFVLLLFSTTLKYLIIVHVRIINFWVKFHPVHYGSFQPNPSKKLKSHFLIFGVIRVLLCSKDLKP